MNFTDIKQIDELLQKRLEGFATREDLKNFTTKESLDGIEKRLSDKIAASEERIKQTIVREVGDLAEVINKAGSDLDKKADKTQISALDARITTLEENNLHN